MVRLPRQEIDDPLHHPAGGCLTGMNSSSDDNPLLLFSFLVDWSSDSQVVDTVPCQSSAEQPQLGELYLDRVAGQLGQVLLKVGISVGVAVRQVNRVLVMRKGDVEGQGVLLSLFIPGRDKISRSFPDQPPYLRRVVLVVADVLSAAPPTNCMEARVLQGVQQRLEAFIVQAVFLAEVDYRQPVDGPAPGVGDPEVEPLHVSLGVQVFPQVQLVVGVCYLDHLAKVPRLEPGLELEVVIQHHAGQRIYGRPSDARPGELNCGSTT